MSLHSLVVNSSQSCYVTSQTNGKQPLDYLELLRHFAVLWKAALGASTSLKSLCSWPCDKETKGLLCHFTVQWKTAIRAAMSLHKPVNAQLIRQTDATENIN